MNSREYVQEALVTEPENYDGILIRLRDYNTARLIHASMGLSTEVGELTDTIKKYIFYGKPMDKVNLLEEHGDLFWYMAILADALGFTFEQSFDKNIAKLRTRYPSRFNEFDALNRNLDTEHNVLGDK